ETAREKVTEAEEVVSTIEGRLSELTAAEARASAERQQLERAVADSRQRADRLVAQAQEAQQALADLDAQMSEQDGVSENREALELAEEELTEAELSAEETEAATREAREQEQAARGPLGDAQQGLQGLETEARTLEQVLNVNADQDHTPVVEQIRVEQGYETALGAALGEDLDASLEETAAVRWGTALPANGDQKLPDGVRSLASVVEAPEELTRRLEQIGIVEQGDGKALRASLKPGQRLVSKEGDLWRWDGFVVAANAPTPAAQRLAQKNRLAELADEIETARVLVGDRQRQLEEAAARVRQTVEQEQAMRGKVRDGQRRVAAVRDALANAERAISQLAARKEAARDRSERLAEEAEMAREQVVEAEERLASAPDATSYRDQIEELQGKVSAARGALAEARAVAEGLSREQQLRDRRLEAIAREYDGWKTRAANATQQISILTERRGEAEEERAELIEAPEDIELKRRELFSAIASAEEEKKARDDKLQQAELDQADVDRAAKAAMEAMSGAREQKIRAEERLEAARERKSNLERQIDEDLEVAVAALPEIAGLKEGAPLPDPEAMERKLDRLKAERERLGGVNLRAEEELREIDEQKETLTSERDDLIEAIRRLRTGISNLNREARERLLASFEVVNGHFQRLFTHLFGGGTAELQLVDSDDPLDAGLEIIARPPGKKPQTMTLLSGGEQALTAMSLIFAVFLTNPAPICVLDEVDAPLDDANVERYCDLLDEMTASTDTRFVVITHNPITMARMNRLFGVTMAERGVSQLVSVDLETAERFRETG
ncbi:MAG: chromosome segregation protein SMC, partial [Roseibium sp.]|nr:chromosome segregation protein SMC [Roseibium sp.]